ncbi:hypothetical protein [Cohnella sp. WQ 127256]|uniref:hypothetical protein n=1 Tax=Cohnella sp. WQ 127256 TaxID=2938790 RepID=UPI0021177911|nr:hypothetical protein [Cohnella sp. WQ 127256]
MGSLFIAEPNYNRIRKVDAVTGLISTVAGTGFYGSSVVDGTRLATETNLYNPIGVAVDSNNNLYIADAGNNRVLKLGSNQKVSRVWNGNSVTGIALDSADRLYIIEQQQIGSTFTFNYRVLRTDGVTDTGTNSACLVAGTSSTHTACVANSAATQEALNGSNAIALDNAGNLYIADSGNHRV